MEQHNNYHYSPINSLRISLRKSMLPPSEALIDDDMELWHLASVFMSKVFSECKRKGVTPRTSVDEISLVALIEEAEKELGIYVSVDDMLLMNKFPRLVLTDQITRRRSFAFTALIRMTSSRPSD